MAVPGWVPIREELRDDEPYGAPQLDVPVQLNTNENPYGPSEETARDIADSVHRAALTLNRYPDREATELRTALATYLGHGLTADQVWAANGSNEVMQQILQAFGGPGRTAISFAPTYSMYPEYARNTHTRWVAGRRSDDFGIDLDAALELIAAERPDVVILTSPNNPTGTALDPVHARALIEAAPGVVVVDEAYAEFRREGTPTSLELLAEFPRLLVTRTMSKAFALAPRSSTRCGSSVCRTTSRPSARRPRRPPCGTRTSCWPRSTRCVSPATRPPPGCASRASTWPSRMRTSCCSAPSRTGTRSGRECWTGAS
jgi:histidinol-phosphate aminotransferase